jgi:hypothetical protein
MAVRLAQADRLARSRLGALLKTRRLTAIQAAWLLGAAGFAVRLAQDEREAHITSYLDNLGTRLDDVRAPGVSAYLYDLTGAAAAVRAPDS